MRACAAVATATPWPAARCFGHGWGSRLEDERVDGERGEGRRSSQRFRRVGQWARGEAGAVGAAMEISGVGRLKKMAWRRLGASGVAQLDEEEEGY